jgi:hypothetical protein
MTDLELTPEARAEVRRNLILAFALTAGGLLLFVFLLALAINPPGSTEGFRLGSLLLVAFVFPGLAMTAACLILAYPMGCWPGFMRARKLAELYGIDAEEMSNQAMRRQMLHAGYWLARERPRRRGPVCRAVVLRLVGDTSAQIPRGVRLPGVVPLRFRCQPLGKVLGRAGTDRQAQ